jgi:hypothetical protein
VQGAASSALCAPRAWSAPGAGLLRDKGGTAARPVQTFRHSGERGGPLRGHAHGRASRPKGGGADSAATAPAPRPTPTPTPTDGSPDLARPSRPPSMHLPYPPSRRPTALGHSPPSFVFGGVISRPRGTRAGTAPTYAGVTRRTWAPAFRPGGSRTRAAGPRGSRARPDGRTGACVGFVSSRRSSSRFPGARAAVRAAAGTCPSAAPGCFGCGYRLFPTYTDTSLVLLGRRSGFLPRRHHRCRLPGGNGF